MPKNLLFYSQLKDNNFNLLRLIAAILVLFSHSFPISGNNLSEWLEGVSHEFISFGDLAVFCFFVISGYLITGSMISRGNPVDYFISRILRIFPGLIASVLFCTFIVGALATSLPLKTYFSDPHVYHNMINNMFLWNITFTLPGVFAHNLYPDAVNGSLWTLPTEFMLYILIGLLGTLKILSSRYNASYFILFFLILPFFSMTTHKYLTYYFFIPYAIPHILPAILCFGLGSLFYLWREKIVLHWSILLILICLTFSLRHNFREFNFLFYLTVTYAVFWFAYHPKMKVHRITQWGDFSYGIYIYAFPVQQTLMYYLKTSSPLGLFLLALPITLLLAVLSWHFIEKPALGLKEKGMHLNLFKRSYKASQKSKAALPT